MFSKTSYKAFKHKAKKGMMKRIGMVESRPEDPNFKAILAAMEKLKLEVKEFHFQTYGAAQAGKSYNNSIEHFCGPDIKGEELFNKEDSFISAVQERFHPTLDQLVEVEIPKMEELVVAYKTAKLKFDSTYFQTVKDMKKKEIAGFDKHEEVLKTDPNLPALQQSYFDSKKEIINQQDVLKGRLENEVNNALLAVQEASNAEHHQLYVEYMKKRIVRTAAICEGTAVIMEYKNQDEDAKIQAGEEGTFQNQEDEKVDNLLVVEQEEHKVEIEEVNSAVNPVEAPVAEEEKKAVEVEQLKLTAESNIPDLEEDEEDIPQPPSRKAPEVPQEAISSPPRGIPQPPAPPAR